MMKPVVPSPRHSRTPAWMRDCGDAAPAVTATSVTASAKVRRRPMTLPLGHCGRERYRNRGRTGTAVENPVVSNAFWVPEPRPAARLRVYCFAHAGAGASTFGRWEIGRAHV